MLHRSIAVALAAAALTLSPAQATEWAFCTDANAEVEVGFLLGSVDAFMPAGATLRHGTEHWTTSQAYGDGALMTIGQGFDDDRSLLVDLYDDGLSEVIAELRIWKAEEGETLIQAGTLHMPGKGAWDVSCDGL